MAIQPGTHLGPYEILSAIGAGGMGEVYRARDSKLGRDVALKVLPAAFARDAERMARFQREAKVLASLNHPNIATIHGLEDSSGTYALVMELVEGPTLADRIKQGPIAIDESLRIAKQICEALEYAHERGIVHRDLKPANVKLTSDDVVKVLDFGLAKAIEGDTASVDIATSPTLSRMATMQGVLLGTAAYMSPEQAKAKPVDRRADIWAFGCVLYEMLTGKQAFTGETVTDTLAAVIMKDPDWSLLPTAAPIGVRVLLQRCLQKDPKQRLQAIGDARISLDEVLAGAPDVALAGASQAAVPNWRRAVPWALLGVMTLAFAALAFLHFLEKPVPPAPVQRFEIPAPDPGITGEEALSPDGTRLVLVQSGEGSMPGRLWLRRMDSLDAHPIEGTEGAATGVPFWSPDSRFVAFGAGGKLKKIDTEGGPAQVLCDSGPLIAGGFWTPDGEIVFGDPTRAPSLWEVPAAGGQSSPLPGFEYAGNPNLFLPSLLPDGKHFLYTSGSPSASSDVSIGSLGSTPGQQRFKKLLPGAWHAYYVPSPDDPGLGYVVFGRGDVGTTGPLMAQPFDVRKLDLVGEPVPIADQASPRDFSVSQTGTLVYRAGSSTVGIVQLTLVDRQGKVLGTVGERGLYSYPDLSPDGTRAAVTQADPQSRKENIWLVDFSRGTTTRFTFGPADALAPIWSADGKRIFFMMSNPSGQYDLYQKPADGSSEGEPLLKSDQTKVPDDVSRDGRFLLYGSLDPKTKYDLWVLPLAGDKKPFLFLRTEFSERGAKFSPDGHWIVYTSDESGRDEIYVRKFSPDATAADSEASGKWQVSYGGGHEPWWSVDGKQLYYLTLDSKVMVVDVTTHPSFQAGTAKTLFQAPPPRSSGVPPGHYTVDGKRFLFLAPAEQGGQAQAPFTVVLNWQAGLKK